MNTALLKIVSEFIRLSRDYDGIDVLNGLEELRNTWPNLTGEESSQLSSIISAYKKLVADELEDIDEEKEKTVIDEHAFNYDYDCIGVMPSYSEEKTKGLLAGLFSRHM